MLKQILVIIAISTLTNSVFARQKIIKPKVVFIHGWLGWGEGKMLGIRAWGGPFLSVRKLFEQESYDTIELGVGPLSSSWDRAIEAYYQLKGGCTDYGLAHSRKHGHERFGRCYPGKLKNWGNKTDHGVEQIHLIGHSLGAATSRLLIDLLHDGNEAEQATDYSGHPPMSELYKGGKTDWVKSLNSIAGVHNGTPLTNYIYDIFPNIILRLAQSVNFLSYFDPITSSIYDFQVDHWGLLQKPGETYSDFIKRFKEHRINKGEDVSLYDLRPEGAFALNRLAEAKAEVAYVSWPLYTTTYDAETERSVGTMWTSPLLSYISRYVGSKNEDWEKYYNSDLSWLKNDGLVPTESQKCPLIQSDDICVPYQGEITPGLWTVMPETAADHLEIIGLTDPFRARTSVRDFWIKLRNVIVQMDAGESR